MKTLPLNKKITLTEKQKENTINLIAALRSKKYRQGTRALKKKLGDKFAYCCLGVGCEILAVESMKGEERHFDFLFRNEACSLYPDKDFWLENYGWDYDAQVILDKNPLNTNLSSLNDSRVSFLKIAKIIESVVIKRKSIEIIPN